LLEILDNFKRALDVETASEDGAALKKGMEMVLNRFEAALKKEGVEEIDSLGKPFDPNFHQAVMQEESQEHESGTVIQVLQAGYTLNGRILRPAMVKVSA
jgi:Molecular chaperone GrpE (heat shock protein)